MSENLNNVRFTPTPYPINTLKSVPNSNISFNFTMSVNETHTSIGRIDKIVMTKDTWKAIAQNNVHKDEWLELAYAGFIKIID